ncbi:hypothetical protein [Streptomyces durocortorensis]|uniref:Uncharacterized protein n=1 Tax=Streptomyces durocortorensis TaxID=2811104 RepID=A0ABS2I307_9ACTN|nr:hypothetical protein [Streptomyces durocortorensis]MBM7057162.1 hypothetical protein [Streptomyces durocortorensis]
MIVRTLFALPAVYVLSRAPQLGGLLVGLGLLVLLTRGGVPLITGLVVIAIALLGCFAVQLACSLPLLATAAGSRRSPQEACSEAADDVADWAGWETGPPNP